MMSARVATVPRPPVSPRVLIVGLIPGFHIFHRIFHRREKGRLVKTGRRLRLSGGELRFLNFQFLAFFQLGKLLFLRKLFRNLILVLPGKDLRLVGFLPALALNNSSSGRENAPLRPRPSSWSRHR